MAQIHKKFVCDIYGSAKFVFLDGDHLCDDRDMSRIQKICTMEVVIFHKVVLRKIS